MAIDIESTDFQPTIVNIKVFGVGGGGNSVLLRMANEKYLNVELIAVNSDAGQLSRMPAGRVKTLQIGEEFTKGRGTGGNVAVGEQLMKMEISKIKSAMYGADLVFVTAGMGGGFGTGAAPLIAEVAKELGVLSIGVVTLPFAFEGRKKMRAAEASTMRMQSMMDGLIAVNNNNVLLLPQNRQLTMKQAFEAVDAVLRDAIRCITELILTAGVINVDFADVTTIFRQSSKSDALLGIGRSTRSAVEAVRLAAESSLVDKKLDGARGVILNITGSDKVTLFDVNEAMGYVVEHTNKDVNIILGTVIDESMEDTIQATIIATDFVENAAEAQPQQNMPQQGMPQMGAAQQSTIDIPAFMNKTQASSDGRAFAMPAFKIADFDKK